MRRRSIAVIAALALASCGRSAAVDVRSDIAIAVAPAALGVEETGQLRFRTGLHLTSPEARFGGLSDLLVTAEGQLLAITDAGDWVMAQLALDAESGLPTGVDSAWIAPMRDETGQVFENKRAGDAEDLALLPDGRVAVSFEQNQTIRLYDVFGAGPEAPAAPGPALGELDGVTPNRGLEALAVLADGRLIAGAEGELRGGSVPFWIAALDADAPAPRAAERRLSLGYGLVALDRLPNGDLIALERFYAPVLGSRVKLVRLDGAAFSGTPARVRRTVLAHLRAPLAVDNFEGVSALALPNGEVRLFVLSDDNFNADQRTLLYVFDWTPPAAQAAAAVSP